MNYSRFGAICEVDSAKAERKRSESGAKAERKRSESGAKAERKRSESGAKAERKRSESGAKAERKRSESGAKAERKRSESGAKAERKRSESGAKAERKRLCAAIQKPGCGATVCAQRKSRSVHFESGKSASNVLLYMKDLQMCAYCPDSRHVPYFIIHCQQLKLNVDFRGESVRWSQTPSPLAYAVYAFINVDNCERPLRHLRN